MIVAVILIAANAAPAPKADEDDPSRLPRTSVPSHYDITLRTNVHLGTRRFDGVVKIETEILTSTETITLHNRALTIVSVRVLDAGSIDVYETHTLESGYSFMHIQTLRPLAAGEMVTIEIEYYGNLQTSMAGFYLSSYRNEEGVTR